MQMELTEKKKEMLTPLVALILAGWLVLCCSAQAASFDCEKAATKVEKMICVDSELSKLDDELAATYRSALQNKKQADSIRQVQKQWVKNRNGCVDLACVKRAYEARLHGLSSKSESMEQEAASLPAQSKSAAPTQPETDESICIAPKIDWRNYRWMLIAGNGLEICEEMLAYLKSRPRNAAPPTCPEERLPPNGNWTRPESRILSEAEKQNLLRDIPERWRQKKPGEWVGYEQEIKSTKLLRVIRGDITRDGVPESFLAFNSSDYDGCERAKRCARPEEIFKKGIVLRSYIYDLLPMNDEGTQVNWSHRTVGFAPLLMGGELIFYKGLPYWMSHVSWSQNTHDDFAHYSTRADDPYSKIFSLHGLGHYVVGQYGGTVKPAPFSDVQHLRGDGDSCEFGYFHRDNLKQHPAKRRR